VKRVTRLKRAAKRAAPVMGVTLAAARLHFVLARERYREGLGAAGIPPTPPVQAFLEDHVTDACRQPELRLDLVVRGVLATDMDLAAQALKEDGWRLLYPKSFGKRVDAENSAAVATEFTRAFPLIVHRVYQVWGFRWARSLHMRSLHIDEPPPGDGAPGKVLTEVFADSEMAPLSHDDSLEHRVSLLRDLVMRAPRPTAIPEDLKQFCEWCRRVPQRNLPSLLSSNAVGYTSGDVRDGRTPDTTVRICSTPGLRLAVKALWNTSPDAQSRRWESNQTAPGRKSTMDWFSNDEAFPDATDEKTDEKADEKHGLRVGLPPNRLPQAEGGAVMLLLTLVMKATPTGATRVTVPGLFEELYSSRDRSPDNANKRQSLGEWMDVIGAMRLEITRPGFAEAIELPVLTVRPEPDPDRLRLPKAPEVEASVPTSEPASDIADLAVPAAPDPDLKFRRQQVVGPIRGSGYAFPCGAKWDAALPSSLTPTDTIPARVAIWLPLCVPPADQWSKLNVPCEGIQIRERALWEQLGMPTKLERPGQDEPKSKSKHPGRDRHSVLSTLVDAARGMGLTITVEDPDEYSNPVYAITRATDGEPVRDRAQK
jgi:hypothetical protein